MHGFHLMILIGVAVVLSILAWLQYGWITDVSDAERDRQQENLSIAATRFAQDFEAELSLLMPFRRQGPRTFGGDDNFLDRLANRYEGWTSASNHAALLQDLFAAEIVAPGEVRLFRYDASLGILQQAEWPAEFSRFRENAINESLGVRPNMPRGGFGFERSDLDDVPAFTIPVMPPPRPGEFGRPPALQGWEIIRLDGRYLSEMFFPSLVQRHFARQGDFDYDILIADSRSSNVVYRSSPELDLSDFENEADARIPLAFGAFRGGPQRGGFQRGGAPPPAGGWDLYAKHHAGSLQSFAEQFRKRNLAISFGIFTILAIGIAFTILSSERVRQMGRLQLEFAAGLSHELRTPLAVIRSAGHNLASGKIAGDADVVRYGKLLQEEGLRLSDMVEQALLFAQTQSGRKQYQRSPVDIAEVINKAVRSCDAILPRYPGEIKVETEPNLPLAMTDAKAVQHCLHNLLVNALKYGASADAVRVTARPTGPKTEPQIEIAVANRGAMIEASDLPHVFEPFFRGRNTEGVPGSGLGLYIVKSIMQSLGGSVTVSSSAQAGTCFTLQIPAALSGEEA
jgi:signal transduction histidine kinase